VCQHKGRDNYELKYDMDTLMWYLSG